MRIAIILLLSTAAFGQFTSPIPTGGTGANYQTYVNNNFAYLNTNKASMLQTRTVYPETGGALGDGSHDDTSAIQAAVALVSTTGGVVQLGMNKNYKVSSAITITANGVQLIGSGFASIPPPGLTQIASTSATADIITMGAATGSGNCSVTTSGLWQVVKGIRLTRSVTPSGTAKGINISKACWARVEDVESDQSMTGIYIKSSAVTHVINTQVNTTGASGSKYGYEIDSTGTANMSTYLTGVGTTGSEGTITGVYLHGDCVADSFIADAATANTQFGIVITSTNGGASYCNGDIHIFRPVLDVVATKAIVITDLTGNYASVEIASGHIDGASGTVGVEVQNSSGVNLHGSQIRVPSGTGVLLNDSSRNIVSDNKIDLTTLGVSLTGTSSNNILFPNIYGATVGTEYTDAGGSGNQFIGPFSCQAGIGDGANAITAATYPITSCFNTFKSKYTIQKINCYTDTGTSTLAATNGAGASLVTGFTCTSTLPGAAGTQSATTTIAVNDAIKFSFVADGTAKQTTWSITGVH